VHDKPNGDISGIIPIKLFTGFKNVDISAEAIAFVISNLAKECYPCDSYSLMNITSTTQISVKKLTIKSNSWEDMNKKIIKAMSISMGFVGFDKVNGIDKFTKEDIRKLEEYYLSNCSLNC
jgi:hypothetical protein